MISWKDHIRTVENEIAKIIGLLYRAKQLFNTIQFHIFINILTTQTLPEQAHKKPS